MYGDDNKKYDFKKGLRNLGASKKFNDIVYTPKEIVVDIIEWVDAPINKTILEPFKGGGAFYNVLKQKGYKVDYCEIEEGKDFFDVNKKYDYIITNPPYSDFTKTLKKCFEIADNVILLIPHLKIWLSNKRIDMVDDYGKYKFKGYPTPKNWTMNFPIAAYWFKKGK